MPIRKSAKVEERVVHVEELDHRSITLRIIGMEPLIQNRMSEKTRLDLLVGGGLKTKAQKAQSVKHKPLEEFQNTLEVLKGGPTLFGIKNVSFKGAMTTAVIDTPAKNLHGTTIKRNTFFPGEFVPLYGIPKLRMDVVRLANGSADIRTRACFSQWCCEVTIRYIVPTLDEKKITTLLRNAGILVGVGDYRQEKGKSSFGMFRVIGAKQKDAEWNKIVKMSRKLQTSAFNKPEFATEETEAIVDLYEKMTGKGIC